MAVIGAEVDLWVTNKSFQAGMQELSKQEMRLPRRLQIKIASQDQT